MTYILLKPIKSFQIKGHIPHCSKSVCKLHDISARSINAAVSSSYSNWENDGGPGARHLAVYLRQVTSISPMSPGGRLGGSAQGWSRNWQQGRRRWTLTAVVEDVVPRHKTQNWLVHPLWKILFSWDYDRQKKSCFTALTKYWYSGDSTNSPHTWGVGYGCYLGKSVRRHSFGQLQVWQDSPLGSYPMESDGISEKPKQLLLVMASA